MESHAEPSIVFPGVMQEANHLLEQKIWSSDIEKFLEDYGIIIKENNDSTILNNNSTNIILL
jgi:hypothetical protein